MNKTLYILFSLCSLVLSPAFCAEKNLLTDGGFECKGDGSVQKYSSNILRHWLVRFNGIHNGEGFLAGKEHAFRGNSALRLVSKGRKQMTSADAKALIEVSPGETVTGRIRYKGYGGAHLHFYFLDQNKKRLKKSFGDGAPAREKWQLFSTRFKVPEGVHYILFSVWAIRKADILFDEAQMTVDRSDLLENSSVKLRINAFCGGVVDSLILKGKSSFNYTVKNTIQIPGGLFADILPANTMPGSFRNSTYSLKKHSGKSAVLERVDPVRNFRVEKTYTLDENKPVLHVQVKITNTGKSRQKLSYRIQNILPPGKGDFSWPGHDWIHAFRSTGSVPGSLNSIHIPKLRFPWAAKGFEEQDTTMKFTFEVDKILKCYTFLAESCNTLEYYYRPVFVDPGKSLTLKSSLELLKGGKGTYRGPEDPQKKVEYILPKALPEPGLKKNLPPGMKNFFPYMASTGIPLRHGALSGLKGSSREKNYARTSLLVTDDFAWSYFNAVYSPLILADSWSRHLWKEGKNILCERLLARNMKLVPTRLLLNRTHIDAARHKVNLEGLKRSVLFKNLFRQYGKMIPCIFTADEIEGKNVEVMLKAHEALRSLVPEETLLFPYVCAPNTELIDYLPVFLGDYYPVNRNLQGGRNPWSIKRIFDNAVRKAKETPVWIMPQGFGCAAPSSYGFPTSGELALMLHLAVASGVKGVVFHGFPNVGWNWVNGQYYDYAFYGAAGQKTPQWKTVSHCGKILTAVGSLLCRTKPGSLPEDFAVQSSSFRAKGDFYEGPSIRAYGLLHKDFALAVCINMNPYESVKGTLLPGKNRVFDLRKMAPASGTLVLPPGEAAYFLLNGSAKEIAEVYLARCQREEARLKMLQEIAQANKVPVVRAEKTSSPALYYKALLRAQKGQKEKLNSSPCGKILDAIRETENVLSEADFILCTFGSAFRQKRIPEQGMALAREILEDFRELNQLKTERLNGFKADSAAKAGQLLAKARKDLKRVQDLKKSLAKRSIFPDDPYR